mgnify:CR=1 FL=1
MTSQEEALRKQAEIAAHNTQIQGQINNLNMELTILQAKLRNYENMKLKLRQAVDHLKSAESSISKVSNGIKRNYQSTIANKKVEEVEKYKTDINTVIGRLQGVVIESASNKINKLNRQIDEVKSQISGLKLSFK